MMEKFLYESPTHEELDDYFYLAFYRESRHIAGSLFSWASTKKLILGLVLFLPSTMVICI
jgi:hypothetical protein